MEQERKERELPLEEVEEEITEERPPFEPSPRWKRIAAWILLVIVIIGVINWLISIAIPDWPARVMEWLK